MEKSNDERFILVFVFDPNILDIHWKIQIEIVLSKIKLIKVLEICNFVQYWFYSIFWTIINWYQNTNKV